MKRQISALLLVLFTLALQAQNSLSGRTYHHPDIMAEGMKAYEFAETAAITASGTIGEEAVVVDAGQFNLATFAAYHSGNADASAASAEALDLINALYDYVSEAKTYADSKN